MTSSLAMYPVGSLLSWRDMAMEIMRPVNDIPTGEGSIFQADVRFTGVFLRIFEIIRKRYYCVRDMRQRSV